MSESTTQVTYTRKDFTSDQAVRWCPGCGDYAILAQTQKVFPDLGRKKEDFVFLFPAAGKPRPPRSRPIRGRRREQTQRGEAARPTSVQKTAPQKRRAGNCGRGGGAREIREAPK